MLKKTTCFILISFLLLVSCAKPSEETFNEGTFGELILSKSDSQQFNILKVEKNLLIEDEKKTSDNDLINEFLTYLNSFELSEYDGNIAKESKDRYMLVLYNSSTSEYLNVIIENKKYIDIYFNAYSDKNYLEIEKKYEITNSEIDIDYIEKIYERISRN